MKRVGIKIPVPRKKGIFSKGCLVMKLMGLLLLASAMQISAHVVDAQAITFKKRAASLEEAFDVIRKQTGYEFLYNSTMLAKTKTEAVDFDDTPLRAALTDLFRNQPLTYTIIGKTIVVKQKKRMSVDPALADKPSNELQGVVVDSSTGTPLAGVTIRVQGGTIGTVTDADGAFHLTVPPDAVLDVSFLGYRSKTIPVNGKANIRILLSAGATGLNQLVVVGYGTQKKVNLTGAVNQVSLEEMEDRPVPNISKMLQGAIPNLNIVFGSGKPGSTGTLNIRGNTSISGKGDPLVLIDGIPGDMNDVNPLDVESVSVLKDASASAIYGARAAFGVILITTKKAKAGRLSVTYRNSFAWKTFETNTDFMTNAYKYFKITDQVYYNTLGRKYSGYSDEDYHELEIRQHDKTENPDRPWIEIKKDQNGQDVYKYYGNFDWFNYFYKRWRPSQKHNLNLMGGTDKVTYLLSGSYNQESGIWKPENDKYKRYDVRSKISVDVRPWLTISNNTRYFHTNYRYYQPRNNFYKVSHNLTTNQLYMLAPAYSPKNPDGTGTYLTDNGTYAMGYGVHLVLQNPDFYGNDATNGFRTTFEAKVQLMDGLTLTGNYSYSLDQQENMYREAKLSYSLYPGVVEQVPGRWDVDQLTETTGSDKYYVYNLFANYVHSFGHHNLNVLLGFNQELKTFKTITSSGKDLLSETLNDLNLSTGEMRVGGSASAWALRGYFYRVNYDFSGKYLLELSGRYDGTSRFPKNQRFGFFPSFSAGWRMSEEPFFEPIKKTVNNLKVRVSYGTLGNQNVATYAYIPTMPVSLESYIIASQKLIAVGNPKPISPQLTWERATTANVGLDASFLNNRLTMTADFYTRATKGMLTKGKTLPSVFGATEPQENAADLKTKGFGLQLKWQDQFELGNSPFHYSVGVNLSDYTATITKFDNPSNLISDYYVGQKLGEIWGFKYDGFFKTTEEAQAYDKIVDQHELNPRRVAAPTAELRLLQAGDIKILDLNGDGVIDRGENTVSDPGDQARIGNSQPRYAFGVPIFVSWKGVSLNAFFQGIIRQQFYPDLESQIFWGPYARPYGSFLPSNFEKLMWSPDNPNAYFPFPRAYEAQNGAMSVPNNMYLQDLGYLKLRNITLSYTLPARLVKKLTLQRLRVYISCENLFTLDKLDTDYIDPEEYMSDPTGRTYPMGKTYSAGIEIGL